MRILVDSKQMKRCDSNTIEHFGIPSLVLMERAAMGVVEEIEKCLPAASATNGILLVCGYGNNGGDGLAIARMLWQKGYTVTVVMPPGEYKISQETQVQMNILERYQISVKSRIPNREFDMVVDALFGIGLTRDLTGLCLEYVLEMNEMRGRKVAVDIPSGINGDTGAVMGAGFYADMTVTFAFAKLGHLLFPGAEYAGEVVVKEIGIDRCSFLDVKPNTFCLDEGDLCEIPSRKTRSNKGSYGKVLTVAGQKNMVGAAFLSAKASYLTGAGLVKILTPEENRVILQQLLPEAILATYTDVQENKNYACANMRGTPPSCDNALESLDEFLSWASVVVAGPGIGTGALAQSMIKKIIACVDVPLILDADGLNIVAEHPEWLKEAKGTVIVTPHLGEMARLIHKDIPFIQNRMLETAKEFAEEYHVICVLKDARTVTAMPGGIAWVNASGNNGMATAGAGDVLTGIIAGLVAQGMEPQYAASIGVYLHGLAGEAQTEDRGTYGLMAQDILEGIVCVLKKIHRGIMPYTVSGSVEW